MTAARTVVVTGAAQGIGRGVADHFAEQGTRVVLWDVRPTEEIASGPTRWAHVESVDVADHGAVAAAWGRTVRATGGVDVVINNAGVIGPLKPLVDYTPDEWRRVLAIDLDGVFNVCAVAVPHLVSRGWGRVVNVASMAGKEGVVNLAAYSAAKAGVIGLTKALAQEVITTGVTVNAVAPAMTATPLVGTMTDEHVASSRAKIPMGRLLEVGELAALVAFVASDACSFTSGFTFDASGGRATY